VIAHVILFTPRAELPDAARQDLLADLATAAATIPSVRRFRVGARVKHGLPGYEQVMATNYAYAAIIEFDDLDGLKAYLAHPAHNAIGGHFTASAERSLAYDYVLDDLPVGR